MFEWHRKLRRRLGRFRGIGVTSPGLGLVGASVKNSPMSAQVYPAKPTFRTRSERDFFNALLPQLGDDDIVFANLELTNDVEGDVEIDFAVLLKDFGLVVIEVKGGHITHDGKDWIQSDKQSSRTITPVAQARRNLYTVRDYIMRKWSLGALRCEWMVAFPDTNIVDPQDPGLPISRIIQRKQLDQMMSSFKANLNTQRTTPLPNFDGWVGIAAKTLLPVVALKTNPEAVLGNNYEFIRSLTHEREMYLDQLAENNRYYVKGPAGSGKTWLAFMQAQRWSAEGKKVAIFAYNRGVITYLERKNAELPEDQRISHIGTFHGYAESLGTTAGEPKNYGDAVDRYRDGLLGAANALTIDEKFDCIVVDEAQDFMPSWWEVLELALKDSKTGKLALFGDDQQMVFGDRPDPQGNFANLRLLENLRNSQQIAAAIGNFIERPAIARGPNAFDVEYVVVPNDEKVFDWADDQVANLTDVEQWELREIALLTTERRHEEHKRRADGDRAEHWDSLWSEDSVFYCSVSGFKGLERPVVVLAVDGFHEGVDPKDVLYVGMSRARDKLIVVARQHEMDLIHSIQNAEK